MTALQVLQEVLDRGGYPYAALGSEDWCNAVHAGERGRESYCVNSRSEENFIRNTSIFGAWNTAYAMEYVEYGWNTGGIQASGMSFGIRGKRIHTVGRESLSLSLAGVFSDGRPSVHGVALHLLRLATAP